jgi:hypothetical protein
MGGGGGEQETQPGRLHGVEGDRVTVAEIVTDPKYNFLNQFNPDSEKSDFNFNEANDNLFENIKISCDYYDESAYVNKF